MKRKRRTMRLLSVLIAVALCCTSVDCSGLGIREVVAAGVQQPDSDEQQTPMEGNPEEKDPEEGDLEEGDPEEKAPGEKDPEEKDPEEGNPEEKDPEEGSPEEKDPEEGDPEEKDPEEGDPEEKDPEEGNPEEKDPEEGDPEEKAPGEKDPEEKDPEEGNPEEKDPEEGDPEEKDPGEGDPEEKNPGEGDPEEKDPEEGNPEEKDPGEENPDGDQEEGEEIYVLSVEKDGVVITISNRDGSAFPAGVTAEVTAYGEDSDVQTLQDELLYSYAEAYMKEHEEEGWEEEREENLELLKEALRQGLGNSLICRISLYDADGNPYEAGNICQTVSIPDSFWQNSSASRDAFWYDSGLSQKAVGSLEETGDGIRVTFDGNVREYFAVFELDCEKIFGEISQMVLLSGSEESKLVHHFILKDGKTDSQIGGVSYALFTDEACQNAVMDKGGQPVAGVTSDAEESRIENVEPEETEDYYIEFTNLPKGYREGDSFVVQCAWKGSEDAAEEYIVTPWKAAELTVYVNDSSQNNVLLSGFTVELFEWSKDASAYGTDSIAVLADNGDGTYSLPKQLRKNEDGSEEEIEDRLTESAENEGKFLIRDTACAEGYEPGTEVEICITDPGYTGEVVLDKTRSYENLVDILVDKSAAKISILNKDNKYIASTDKADILDKNNWASSPVPGDTEFYIHIKNMQVDETKVCDGTIYTMNLPDELIPELEEADQDAVVEEWTVLEKLGAVEAWGRIVEIAEAEDSVAYQFQVYFKNTKGNQDISFAFQYNASLDEELQAGGKVEVTYETGHELSFEVKPKVSEDFTIEKSAAWTIDSDHSNRTGDTISGNVEYNQIEYTITITNNGDPAVPVTASLEELLPQEYANAVISVDQRYLSANINQVMEIRLQTEEGGEEEKLQLESGQSESNSIGLAAAQNQISVQLRRDGSLTYNYNAVIPKWDMKLEGLSFKTLKITYWAYPYYGTAIGYTQRQSSGQYGDSLYRYLAATTLTSAASGENPSPGKKYEASAVAVKNFYGFSGNLRNSGGTYNSTSTSNKNDVNDKTGKIQFYYENVNSGGERWLQIAEEPMGSDFEYRSDQGASLNYYYNAYDFCKNAFDSSFEGSLLESVSIRVGAKELTSNDLKLIPLGNMPSDDILSHMELSTLLTENGYDISKYYANLPTYVYSYEEQGKEKKIWVVVSPETYEAAQKLCSTPYLIKNHTYTPLEDLKTGKPLGIKLYILGIQGKTVTITYNKYQRSLTPNAANLNGNSLENGYGTAAVVSGIFARNRMYQDYKATGTKDYGIPDEPMLTKEGELLADGAIKWTLTMDVGRLAQYDSLSDFFNWTGWLLLYDQYPEGYTNRTSRLYDEDFRLVSSPSGQQNFIASYIYYQQKDGTYVGNLGTAAGSFSSGQLTAGWKPEVLGDEYSAIARLDWKTLLDNSYMDGKGRRIVKLMYITAPETDSGLDKGVNLKTNKVETVVPSLVECFNGFTNPVRNRIYDVAAAGSVVIPSEGIKSMAQSEENENVWNVKVESQTYTYSGRGKVYFNGVYSVKDDMKNSTVNDEITDVAKYVRLNEISIDVQSQLSSNGFSGSISIENGSGTVQEDGRCLYENDYGNGRKVRMYYTPVKSGQIGDDDSCGMYEGFELSISGLKGIEKITLDYTIEFDYEAFLADHPGLGMLDLKLQNVLRRNYESITKDKGAATSSQNSFSVAVQPSITKKLLAPDSDTNTGTESTYGGYHKFEVEADVGLVPQQSVYLVDQVYQAVEEQMIWDGESSGEYSKTEDEYSPEQIALLMQFIEVNDLKIVMKNRMDSSVEETVFEKGTAAQGWTVTPASEEEMAAISVPEEGVELDGNVFGYLVEKSDGSAIGKGTYFTVTYSMQFDPERRIGQKTFRDLEFYQGGIIKMDNQAAIGYPVSAGGSMSRARSAQNVSWAAAGAMVENVAYLEYKEGIKEIVRESDDSLTWALGAKMYTAGKDGTVSVTVGDRLNIEALNIDDDEVNRQLAELLVKHLTVSDVKVYYKTDQYEAGYDGGIALSPVSQETNGTKLVYEDAEGRRVTVTPNTNKGLDGYEGAAAGEKTGHGYHELFAVEASGFRYQEKFWVEYTTVVDWNAIFEDARKAGIFAYDEAASLAYHLWNEGTGDVRVTSEKSWNYPVSYSGSIAKKAKANTQNNGIDWTISLNTGKSGFGNFTLEDEMKAMEEEGKVDENSKKALESMAFSSFCVRNTDGKVLYTHDQGFEPDKEFAVPDVDGAWSGASLTFKQTGFVMKFDSLRAENHLEVQYTTTIDEKKFLEAGGDLTQKIEISNVALGNAGEISFQGDATGAIDPNPGTEITKAQSQEGLLDENTWSLTASVGSYDTGYLEISDTLSAPKAADFEQLKDYLSIVSMKVSLTEGGDEELTKVIYDSAGELDELAQNHFSFADGWKLKSNGSYDFTLIFNEGQSRDVALPKGTKIFVEYTTKLDRISYLAAGNKEGIYTLKNTASLKRDGNVQTKVEIPPAGTVEVIREPLMKNGRQTGYDNDGNAILQWEMKIFLNGYYTKTELKDAEDVVITDILPYGLTYKDKSVKLYELSQNSTGYIRGKLIAASEYDVEAEGRRVNIHLKNPADHEKFMVVLETIATASLSNLSNDVRVSMNGKQVEAESPEVKEVFVKHQSGVVQSRQKLGNVALTKTDEESQNELAGAEFELRDAAGNAIGLTKDDKGYHFDGEAEEDKLIHTLVTDAGGDILIDGLPYGTYSLVETKQPSGYQKPSETEAAHTFTIDDSLFTKNSDGTYTARTFEISAVNKPVKVIVKKVFAETVQGQEYSGDVKGAKLEIWDKAKKNKFAEWTTDGEEEGHEVKCLVPGDYVLVESSAPDGFLTAQEIPFTIDEDGALRMKGEAVVDDTVTMRDKAVYGKIILNKEGEVLKDLGVKEVAGGLLHTFEWIFGKLENVTFAIFAEEDIRIQDTVVFKKDQKIGTIYTGVDGIATMEGLLPGRYYAREISNADGNYKVDSMTRFSLVLSYKDSDTPIVVAEDTVLNERHKAEVQLIKTDADDGGKPVAGAVYGLYAAEDNRILKKDELLAKAVTDETGKAAFAVDLPVGNYYVKELESPDGYLLNEAVSTIEFTKESKFSLQVTDTARKLRIGKVDPDGKPVSGALLQLLNADGKEIDSWMSGEDYHEICAVAPGNYTLREKKAPEGYETAGDMEIVVKEKDSVVAVNMVDVPAESEEPTQEETETEETETEETTPEETPEETTQPSPTESVPEEPRKPSGEEPPSGGEEQPGEDQASDSSGEGPAVTVSRTAQPETVEESAETESAELSGTEIPSTGTGDKAPVEAAAATLLFSLIVILVLMRKKRESNGDIEK